MSLIVQKYGGTSVADPERIAAVADHITRTRRQGHGVVVAVSAMGKSTDDLIRLANEVASNPGGREMDMLLTAGERISIALLSMAILDRGVPAVSFTGSQAGIVTDTAHGKAKILEIKADRLKEALDEGQVCIVAGFQGVSTGRDITTLGRGGSDTTAVALAAALNADACEIYTDVAGVYSADPRICHRARRLSEVSFDEMLEMSASGGRVLALRSVEFARRYNVPLHVRSSFTWEPGTWVRDLGDSRTMEDAVVTGVTHDASEAKLTITDVPDRPGIAALVFRTLAAAGVNVDMIVQNVSHSALTDISFTVPSDEARKAESVIADELGTIGAQSVSVDDDIARVSIVGAGMKSHPGVAATMFETLADNGVNIDMISTSTIRTSCVVRRSDVELAVRSLHTAFGLDVD
ncbi:MAG: aspartate kinase [Acidimicrobiia bacterium]|jgi:aspartate kinase|nr:aspartate kinase [Acidimicrobiia bacterium]MBP8179619.1 aspartate kinase [Acidimicrobiia bacterium]